MEGCTVGKHVGMPLDEQMFLCINHGEVGPGKTYPDSFCGAPYPPKNPANCAIHIGYLNKSDVWSCCSSNVFING